MGKKLLWPCFSKSHLIFEGLEPLPKQPHSNCKISSIILLKPSLSSHLLGYVTLAWNSSKRPQHQLVLDDLQQFGLLEYCKKSWMIYKDFWWWIIVNKKKTLTGSIGQFPILPLFKYLRCWIPALQLANGTASTGRAGDGWPPHLLNGRFFRSRNNQGWLSHIVPTMNSSWEKVVVLLSGIQNLSWNQ